MNPFTQSLLRQVKDQQLVEFVTRWDELEALVVRVYKTAGVSAQDVAEHAGVRVWLRQHYPQWAAKLRPYWPRTRAGGEPLAEDPFLRLLAPARAAAFVDNWAAMQTLPAAREALNMLLVDIVDK
jgi:hypothetical protein